jgi:hypothetical protein
MPRPNSPQFRFLARALVLFIGLVGLWWFVLLSPMLEGLRITTGFLLRTLPGGDRGGNILVDANQNWVLRAPLPAAHDATGRRRFVRLAIPPRVPNLFTLGLPLFWAVVLAAPGTRRLWRILAIGTTVLACIAPLALLVYLAQIIKSNLYPASANWAGRLIDLGAYLSATVIPYAAPVLLAVGLNRELRDLILTGQTVVARSEPAVAPVRKVRRR